MPLPSITGLAASGPIAPNPSTAVPLVITPMDCRARNGARAGSLTISSHVAATLANTPARSRWLVRLGGGNRDLPGLGKLVIVECRFAQGRIHLWVADDEVRAEQNTRLACSCEHAINYGRVPSPRSVRRSAFVHCGADRGDCHGHAAAAPVVRRHRHRVVPALHGSGRHAPAVRGQVGDHQHLSVRHHSRGYACHVSAPSAHRGSLRQLRFARAGGRSHRRGGRHAGDHALGVSPPTI